MNNPFACDVGTYKKDGDYLKQSLYQRALYISRKTGDPVEEVFEWVKNKAKKGEKGFRVFDPAIKLLTRDWDTQDRSLSIERFSQHLKNIDAEGLITSPALTSYYNQHQRRSLSGKYIQKNLGKRKEQKAKKFQYMQLGDKSLENFYQNAQTSTKYLNNSLSGARSSKGNIFFCRSAHPTLTSTCRTATSTANAHNEKFIMGNRYYPNRDVITAHILTVMQVSDSEKTKKAIEALNLNVPDADGIMEVITRSSSLYSRSYRDLEVIRELVVTMTREERAHFAFAGDLYHLHAYNPELVIAMLDALSEPASEPVKTMEEAEEIMKQYHEDIKLHACFLCGERLAGQVLGDVKKKNPELFQLVAATMVQFHDRLAGYQALIDAFWIQDIPPNNVSQTALMPRRCVPLSDTDSTVFTNQYWTCLVRGQDKVDFTHKSSCVANAVTFITAQIVRHWMATLSTNFGVPVEFRSILSMKNEFYTPLLALSTVSKHYIMLNTVQEGNILKKPDLDVKGVNLRNSNWPNHVREAQKNWLKKTFENIMGSGQISIHDFLKPVYDQEISIIRSIEKGQYDYLSNMRINDRASYKNPESSNYVHHEIWEEVFAEKYGDLAPPPYRSIKVPVKLNKPAHIKRWLNDMEDQALAERMRKALALRNKTSFTNILVPEQIAQGSGLPKEIVDVVDVRKIFSDTLGGFYMALGAFGISLADEKQGRFLIDVYDPPA